MRFKAISIRNFLSLRALEDLQFGDITLVCGDNGAGKSSVQNAVRLALCGEVSRLKLKGDWPQLVRQSPGINEARVDLSFEHGGEAKELAARIPLVGKGYSIPVFDGAGPLLPWVLDPTRYERATEAARRKALLELAGEYDTADLIEELKAADADMEAAEEILPMVAAGWEAAVDEAKDRAKQSRADWVRVTGENYGAQKAHDWRADASAIEAEGVIHAANRLLHEAAVARLDQQISATNDALQNAQREAWIAEHAVQCPECGHELGNPAEAEAKRAVVTELTNTLRTATSERSQAVSALDQAVHGIELSEQAQAEAAERTEKAQAAHKRVVTYNHLAELFGPDGVPARLLRGVVERINSRLHIMRDSAGLVAVGLAPNGDVEIDFRNEALASEAERWLAYAAIAEALAHLSGCGVVMLDRFDVLSPKNRGAFLKWVRAVADTGTQVVLFGTLKQAPTIAGISVHWIERQQTVVEAAA